MWDRRGARTLSLSLAVVPIHLTPEMNMYAIPWAGSTPLSARPTQPSSLPPPLLFPLGILCTDECVISVQYAPLFSRLSLPASQLRIKCAYHRPPVCCVPPLSCVSRCRRPPPSFFVRFVVGSIRKMLIWLFPANSSVLRPLCADVGFVCFFVFRVAACFYLNRLPAFICSLSTHD